MEVIIIMRFKRVKAMLLAASVMVSSLYVPVANAETQSSPATQEYIVLAKNDVGYDKVEDNYYVNEELSEGLEDDNIVVASMTAREAKKLERDKNILLVEEDITLEGSDYEDTEETDGGEISTQEEGVTPEDQWNIDVIGASSSEYNEASDNVKVAIIDSGVVATSDIDIKERVNFIDDYAEPLYEDISGHGTSVASIIGAKDNGYGITGINPNAELYSLRVLDNHKKAPLSRIINAINWCIDNDIDIINMSFGTTARSEILETAIKDADRAGILMIGAAGNNGETSNAVEYPAAFDEVVAVGAMTPDGEVSDISSMGDQVELLAPGESVPATDFFDEVVKTDGTSVAAPHITGVASVLLAKDNTKSPRFVRELMKVSSKKINNNDPGVVDLDYALSVYDDFAESYTEALTDYDYMCAQNTASVETYNDTEVEALWSPTNHQTAIDETDTLLSYNVKNIIKQAQYYADNLDYLKGNNENGQNVFHGGNNYIANYVYLMRIARKALHNKDIAYVVDHSDYPYPEGQNNKSEGTINDRLKNYLTKDFKKIMDKIGVDDTKENRGRFIAGLAIHTLMDAYAHKAYVNDGHGNYVLPKTRNDRDDITIGKSRYLTAKAAAIVALFKWHYNVAPNGKEFYQPEYHNANEFKLYKFYTFMSQVDSTEISISPQWYSLRSIQ